MNQKKFAFAIVVQSTFGEIGLLDIIIQDEAMKKNDNWKKPQKCAGILNISRLSPALRNSLVGLNAAMTHEAAFRQELLLAAIMIPTAIVVPMPVIWKMLLSGSVILVLIIELLNSGIEAIVDKVSPEYHELAKRAKDMGSAAVLLGLINLIVFWLVAFWELWQA